MTVKLKEQTRLWSVMAETNADYGMLYFAQRLSHEWTLTASMALSGAHDGLKACSTPYWLLGVYFSHYRGSAVISARCSKSHSSLDLGSRAAV